jgi:hypothetical protein
MRGAIPPLPQYSFMAWCSVKHRDTLPYLTLPYGARCFILLVPGEENYKEIFKVAKREPDERQSASQEGLVSTQLVPRS